MRFYSIRQTFFRVILVCYTLAVLYFSLTPQGGAQVKEAVAVNLVLLHALTYLAIGLLAALAFPDGFDRSPLKTVVAVTALGLLVEVLQIAIPGRFFTVADVAANGLGAALVLLKPYVGRMLAGDGGGA